MDFTLTRKTIEAEKQYASEKVQMHLRAEAMVLGAGRDNVDVLLSDCRVRITSVQAQPDRVTCQGEAVCQAAYRVDSQSGARAANASVPVSCAFDMKGVLSGMTAKVFSEDNEVNARYENGHMVFDVYLTLSAVASSLVPVQVIAGIQNGEGIEAAYKEIKSVKLAAESEALAVLSQTVSLPAALDARYALMEWATISQLDHQKEPGGIRVSGNVLVETLISTGLTQKPVQLVKYRLPIDRFMEMPEWLTENVQLDASVLSVKTSVNQAVMGEDASLLMEAEIEITASALAEDEVNALTDAFSTGETRVLCDNKTIEICENISRITMNEPFRASVLLKDATKSVSEVCAVKTRASVGEVTTDGKKSQVSGVVNAQVVYVTADGEMMAENQDLPFEIEAACALDPNGRVRVSCVSPEGNALMSDRIEIKCMLLLTSDKRTNKAVSFSEGILEEGENKRKKGVMIVWPQRADTAWTIAKRYLTPVINVENAINANSSNQNPLVLWL
ncbi:MAG: DUF3794 domain-containing protein [Clostridia bacterium]|nr:DUF3794 domain-containing protein [Clostridia bacterium]